MLREITGFVQAWISNENRPCTPTQDEDPHHTDSPEEVQLSPSELSQSIEESWIVISPSEQQPTGLDPAAGAPLRHVGQSKLVAEHVASTSAASLHSKNAQKYSKTSYLPVSRSPSLRSQLVISRHTSVGTNETKSHSTRSSEVQGSFANAHDFTIGSAIFLNSDRSDEDRRAEQERRTRDERRIEEERKVKEEQRTQKEKRVKEEQEAEEKKQEKKAFEKLAAKGIPGAMLDSKDRGYVPRCNEDTRKSIRARIVKWSRTIAVMQRLLWLSGPAGVGKSAVAQTVAEEFKQRGFLGAAFFFSRPNNRSDPDAVIPTLVYQLALLLPKYRHIICQKLIKDPLILNKNRRSQFKELIVNPFLSLTAQVPSIVQRPLLIVLDGLDECSDREAQSEFVEMISHHTHKEGAALRLRWLICSRPEPDLKVAFSKKDCRAMCHEEKLQVDESEAQRDARQILAKGFADIRQKYPDQLTKDWPTEDQVRYIAERASGHLGFVSFILRFVRDKQYDDPSGQLNVCLKFLQHTSSSTDINPLHALDLLYNQILSDIPKHTLTTTQRILGLFIHYNAGRLTAVALANFLGLDQAVFYRSLQRLHSVIQVPSALEAHSKPLRIYHASFSDYLKDPARSGRFVLEESVVPYFDVAISGLKWLGYGRKSPSRPTQLEMTWIPQNASRDTILYSLCSFSFTPCWKACLKVPEDLLPALFEVLEKFDFNLDYTKWWEKETEDFACFIRWLATSGHCRNNNLVVAANDGPGTWTIVWHRDDPSTFTIPVSGNVRPSNSNGVFLRVGRGRPANIWLNVSRTHDPYFNSLAV